MVRSPLLALVLLLLPLALPPNSFAQSASGMWQRLGPEGGQVLSLAGGADGVLYLGTPDGHIFVSTDGAGHWDLRGRVSARLDAVVQRLLVDTSSPQRLLAAVWFQDPAAGGDVFRSEDAGRTWSLAGLAGEAVRALEQSASQPDFFVAGTRSGVFRSRDAGRTWERISPFGDPELRNVDSLAFDPRDSRIIYVGTYHLPWKTTDGGQTWSSVAAGMIDDSDVMALRVDARDPAHLFASACSGIYRTSNAGGQWTKLEGVPYAARRTQDIVQDPADPRVLYAGTTEGLWITRDSGESWTRNTPRDWVVNDIAVLPATSTRVSRIILGTEDRGIQVSDDAGVNFAPSNAGFTHRRVLAFAASSSEPGHWLARFGSSDEPLLETRDKGESWKPMPALPSLRDARIFGTAQGWFAAPTEGGLLRYDASRHEWQAFRFLRSSPPRPRNASRQGARRNTARTVPPAPFVRDLLFAGTRLWVATSQGIWSSDAAAATLRPIASDRTADTLALDVESDGAAFRLWAITSAGLASISNGRKSTSVESLPADAGELFWVRCVRLPGRSGLLVGSSHGVYWRAAESTSWRHLAAGLPGTALVPVLLSGTPWILAGKAGGLYLSSNAGDSWSRLDGPSEASLFLASAPDGHGFVVASRTEGVLGWKAISAP